MTRDSINIDGKKKYLPHFAPITVSDIRVNVKEISHRKISSEAVLPVLNLWSQSVQGYYQKIETTPVLASSRYDID